MCKLYKFYLRKYVNCVLVFRNTAEVVLKKTCLHQSVSSFIYFKLGDISGHKNEETQFKEIVINFSSQLLNHVFQMARYNLVNSMTWKKMDKRERSPHPFISRLKQPAEQVVVTDAELHLCASPLMLPTSCSVSLVKPWACEGFHIKGIFGRRF